MSERNGGARILLVDDDAKLRRVVTLSLESEGLQVIEAESGEDALGKITRHKPAFVLTDLRMPGMDGIELMQKIHAAHPGLPVLILTAHGDIPEAVRATQAGALDFLTKPVDREKLVRIIGEHLGPEPAENGGDWSEGVVTRSVRMQDLLEAARRVARTDSSVLISGPSGSGKEVLARAIHRASRRKGEPFVAINCGAVPAELLESELFGHKKGAFTGANADHTGLFRAAEGGTLFLDEIGDMPLELQVKLLRVVQEREIRPVGETRTIPVNVRILSATHRDLMRCVESGSFREDLYYRLRVVDLRIPPLDERREDIPLLVAERLRQLAERGAPRRVFSPDAMEVLAAARWPGNVRELFNAVEQNVALSPGRVISAAQVRNSLGQETGSLPSFDDARAEFTRNYLRQLLSMAKGNVSRAARLAERNRTDFYKLLKRFEVDPAEFKAD